MRRGVGLLAALGWLGGLGGGHVSRAVAASVPEVVLSAATVAAPVDAAIAEVTVFSDRARVRRRGKLAATRGAGPTIVQFADLPGAVFIDTIRVAAEGARVLRVEATPVERERLSIEQARKWLDELDVVNDALTELGDPPRSIKRR